MRWHRPRAGGEAPAAADTVSAPGGGAAREPPDGAPLSTAWKALRARVGGLAAGLRTVPSAAGWAESALWAALLLAVAAPLAWAGDLVGFRAPAALGPRTLLLPFLVPALLEECLFRGLLLPHPTASGVPAERRARWWAASLTLYVVAHPLAAALLRPGARGVFDAPAFLLEAGLLGVTATALYERSGSLWPGVLLHGALVAAWLSLGGLALLSG